MPLEVATAVRQYLAEHPAAQGPLVRAYRPGTRPIAAHTIGTYIAHWMAAAGVKERPHDGRSAQ